MSEDLPTLERPMKAYSGSVLWGQDFTEGLLCTKVAECINIVVRGLDGRIMNRSFKLTYWAPETARASGRIGLRIRCHTWRARREPSPGASDALAGSWSKTCRHSR